MLKSQKGSSDSSNGIGCFGIVGIVLAAIISYQMNGSILWAIFHGALSWFYVIYAFVAGYVNWF